VLLESAFYLIQAMAVLCILTVELGLLTRNLAVPIVYYGDSLYFLMLVKSIIREGWWWHVQSLSAPFGADLVAVPLLGDFDGVLIKIIALFTHKAGLVLNLFWFTTIVLAGTSSTWSMRRLGVRRWIAFVIGILYAVSPHIYYRNESHMMLTHHVIPIVALFAILLCAGRNDSLRGSTLKIVMAGCLLMGLSYVYFAFFSCFIFLVAGISGYMRTRELRILGLAGVSTAVVALTLGIATLPSIMKWKSDTSARRFISFKSPLEADVYGLKIRQLIAPTPRNPIPFLAMLTAKSSAARFPNDENESQFARIGSIGSLGLLFLIAIAVLHTTSQTSPSMELLRSIAVLTLACILLATVGGFGSIFNLLVAPDIRCYNRISIFIAFFSLTAVGIILTGIHHSVAAFLKKRMLPRNGNAVRFSLKAAGAVSLGAVLVFGVLDQNEAYAITGRQPEYEATFLSQQAFVKAIENILPKGAMVYSFPDVVYSEGPHLINRMSTTDPAELFAVSDSLRWSWPAISEEATTFQDSVKSLGAPPAIFDKLRGAGFKGIFIDRYGYEDNASALIEVWKDYLGQSPMESDNSRYAFFEITSAPARIVVNHQNYEWGTPLRFANNGNVRRYLVSGWDEGGGNTLGKQATLYFNNAVPPKDIVISARIAPALFGEITVRPVRIFVNDELAGEWQVQKRDWYSISVPRRMMEGKYGLSIRLELTNAVSPASLGINIDGRELSVAFEEMNLKLQ
jgi:phosphoglycerol transferase